jgi:hypothetical protein
MTNKLVAGLIVSVVSSCLAYGAGNGPVIGMALAQGGARVDNAKIFGSATLFDGANFQADGYSRLEMKNGTRLDLGAGSRAQVFANRVALESGLTEVQSTSGFEIEARTLKINPASAGAIARVRVDGPNSILVTALNAPVNVMNSEGVLVARVMPNLPMSFVPQAGAANSFNSNGCVVNKNGTALLVDDNKQVFQLSSSNVSKMVGKRASVRGTIDSSATPQQGATQVVNVSSISNGPRGGQSCTQLASSIGATTSAAGLAGATGAGSAAGAGTASAAGAAAGAGGGAGGSTGAIVGGVVAAAAGIGVATGIAVSNNGNSSPQ